MPKPRFQNFKNPKNKCASKVLEIRAFLKTVKPLQLSEKRALWDPQILEKLSTPKAPPPRKTAKPLTALSKFLKLRKRMRFKNSRNSSLFENSETAATVCGKEPFGCPRVLQKRSRGAPLGSPNYSGIFLKTHDHILTLQSISEPSYWETPRLCNVFTMHP